MKIAIRKASFKNTVLAASMAAAFSGFVHLSAAHAEVPASVMGLSYIADYMMEENINYYGSILESRESLYKATKEIKILRRDIDEIKKNSGEVPFSSYQEERLREIKKEAERLAKNGKLKDTHIKLKMNVTKAGQWLVKGIDWGGRAVSVKNSGEAFLEAMTTGGDPGDAIIYAMEAFPGAGPYVADGMRLLKMPFDMLDEKADDKVKEHHAIIAINLDRMVNKFNVISDMVVNGYSKSDIDNAINDFVNESNGIRDDLLAMRADADSLYFSSGLYAAGRKEIVAAYDDAISRFDVDIKKLLVDFSTPLLEARNEYHKRANEIIKQEEDSFVRRITKSYEDRGIEGASTEEVNEIFGAYTNDPAVQDEINVWIRRSVKNAMNREVGKLYNYNSFVDLALESAVRSAFEGKYASHDASKKMEIRVEEKNKKDKEITADFNDILLRVAENYGFDVSNKAVFDSETATAITLGLNRKRIREMLEDALRKGAINERELADGIGKLFFNAFYGLDEHDFSKTVAYFVDVEKLHAKLREEEKFIDEIKSDLKTDEIRTREASFYERTIARTDVDIFFLADNTGSMGGVITSVRDNAQAILDGLRTDLENDPRFATGSQKVNAWFGVGRYLGDPSESGETATSAYELVQVMTDSDKDVKAALDKWDAWGGGDWEEGNFYAIQQAIESGAGTPRDATLKSDQKTGWRKNTDKVIVIFGDAPSWQNSVNEKELKALLRKHPEIRLVFIDTAELNGGSSDVRRYDSHNTAQVRDAAVELADASGGVYMKLTDLDKMKEAVVDSVFDALADNTWRGGMLARLGSGADQQWRVRTPSSVTATSEDEGKTLNIALRSPGQPTSGFTVDPAASTRVQGTRYYAGKITDAKDIFGKDYSAGDSVFHTNTDNSFMRFILRDGADGVVEGYYGERLSNATKLPSSAIKTISSYDMRHRVINPNGSRDSSAAGAMKLFINWTGEDVYGIETHANLAGGAGTALFIGKVDRSRTELTGQYAFKTREASGSPLVIRDAARDTTTLQIYGKNGAAGLGGTFGAVFDGSGFGSSGLSSMTMSGFRNQAAVSTTAPVPGDVWKGFAAGWVRSGGSVQSAYSSNPDEVQITFSESSNSVATNVNMRMEDGTGALVGFANDWLNDVNGSNVYLNKDAFVAVKDMNGTPSFVAAAGDDGYDYQTWGVWSVESSHSGLASATVLDGSYWIAGTMTSIADMQLKTGTATYNGHVHGTAREGGALHALTGTSKLTANFDSGTIGGHLNINYVNGGAYATSDLSSVSIIQNGGQNTNRFAGSLGGADNVGNIQGAFYGPGAAEVGGNWSINKDNGASHATGIFAGKQ